MQRLSPTVSNLLAKPHAVPSLWDSAGFKLSSFRDPVHQVCSLPGHHIYSAGDSEVKESLLLAVKVRVPPTSLCQPDRSTLGPMTTE